MKKPIDDWQTCIFAGFCYAAAPDGVVKRLLAACYGWDALPDNILAEFDKETLKTERKLNRRAGFTAKDNRLPALMTREPLPPHNSVFDVRGEELGKIFREIE